MSSAARPQPPDQPVVITANRLSDGRVVWLGAGGQWVEHLAAATAVQGPAAEAALAQGKAAEAAQFVTGAYPAKVTANPAGPQPISWRERIRSGGPTTVSP